jgi:hypothetical protein
MSAQHERKVIDQPHAFDVAPYSNASNCKCGMALEWRAHQPWWWRWTHAGNWRQSQ